MNAAGLGLERPAVARAGSALALAAGGTTLLALRPALLGTPATGPILLLTYLALWGASVAAPGGLERPRLPAAAVLAVGVLAIALATVTLAPRPPSPSGGVAAGAAALGLNAVAAVAEEAFFRRFLYARLAGLGAAAAVVVSALAFAAVHVPAYGTAVFWVDLGAGLLLSWQRWASGDWTVPAATHAAANLMAVIR